MLIKNARIVNLDNKLHSIYINSEGIVECIDCMKKDGEVIDVQGRILLPPFVNPHSHLGYSMTIDISRLNVSGTLTEGARIVREETAKRINDEELKQRLTKIIEILFSHGIFYVRTHELITLETNIALKTLKIRYNPLVTVQVVTLPAPGVMDEKEDEVIKTLESGAEVVGFVPQMELNHELGVKSIKKAFEIATSLNKLVDGHVDETDDPSSKYSELVIAEAMKRKYGHKTAISHMTASHSYDNWYFHELLYKLADSGVSVVSNPMVSLYLQGRYDPYPKRRGIARIKDMLNKGINVGIGTDNVMDPIFPLGDYNMLRVLNYAFITDHFSIQDIPLLFKTITYNSAKILGIEEYGKLEEGKKAEFIILNEKSMFDALVNTSKPFLVVRGEYMVMNRLESSGVIKHD